MKLLTLLIAAYALLAITEALLVTTAAAATAVGAVVAGGLAALKVAKVVGGLKAARRRRKKVHHPRHHYHRRSVADPLGVDVNGDDPSVMDALEAELVEGENLLLSAVGHFDTSGCILNVLCQIETKSSDKRNFNENILVEMFTNDTETLSDFNAPFVHATKVGSSSKNASVCNSVYAECPLSETQLGELLREAWGCGTNDIGN